MPRAWDIQCTPNPWFSLGIHIDHKKPHITLHLPGLVILFGRTELPGFQYSLRFGKQYHIHVDEEGIHHVEFNDDSHGEYFHFL